VGYYRFPQAVVDALDVLDNTALGHAWANYLRRSRIQIMFYDSLGGPGGTAWFGRRIFFPRSMLTYLEPDRLVHELVHTTQGPYLFGALEHERAAYIVQYRYLAETMDQPSARDFYLDIVSGLHKGGQEAYDWVRQQGPYYHHFPIDNPMPWQVDKWWPQVKYAVAISRHRVRGDVQQG
jgi:hypothetical protein